MIEVTISRRMPMGQIQTRQEMIGMGVSKIYLEQYRVDVVLTWGDWTKVKKELASINVEVNVSADHTDTGFTYTSDGYEILLVWIRNPRDHYSIVHEAYHTAHAVHKICKLEICDEHFAYMISYIEMLFNKAIKQSKHKTFTTAIGTEMSKNEQEDDGDEQAEEDYHYSGWGFRPSGANDSEQNKRIHPKNARGIRGKRNNHHWGF